MVSKQSKALLVSCGLLVSGLGVSVAWQHGLWGLFAGSSLIACSLIVLQLHTTGKSAADTPSPAVRDDASDAIALGVLLDSVPSPLLGIQPGAVRAINRAARIMFGTDDRVVPMPDHLLDRNTPLFRHAGRTWRIDRVQIGKPDAGQMVIALVDVEQERITAEARATAELMEVLGHELVNGLAPIVSLTESALAASTLQSDNRPLLQEILGTLARRADGLQRFTEAYRALARIPDALVQPVQVGALVEDLIRLFAVRWPDVQLVTEVEETRWELDHNQIVQALWALMQNAAEAAIAHRGSKARVTLTVSRDDAGLIMRVSDNGLGISPDRANNVFRLFHTTKEGGSGIGLSLARQIAYTHGGSLSLEPRPPTTFRLFLPPPERTGAVSFRNGSKIC